MKAVRWIIVAMAVLPALTGCTHSRVVKIILLNNSAARITNIIVDYPTATFGIPALEPNKDFPYTIKPLGTGPLKIQFTDAQGHTHQSIGPVVHKDDEGTIEIKLTQEAMQAEIHLDR